MDENEGENGKNIQDEDKQNVKKLDYNDYEKFSKEYCFLKYGNKIAYIHKWYIIKLNR